jgi:uncharacterized membrane protein
MGGEGTINSMLISLKNNKKLLIRRKTLFHQNHSHKELKQIYSQRIEWNNKTLTELEKRIIREKIRIDLKRKNQIRILVISSTMILVSLIAYSVLTGLTFKSNSIEKKKSHKSELKIYDEGIYNGLLNLNTNQPFLAIGHFENALAVRKKDELAIEKLILSYEMLCKQQVKTCMQSMEKIDSLKKELK